MIRHALRATLAALILLVATAAWAENACDITAEDAFARASNPASGAVFVTLRNSGARDDRLVAVRSKAAARVELHDHVEEDGIMRMVHLEEGLALPAGGAIEMRRGGIHVMLMGLTEPLAEGDLLSLILVFESGAEISLDVPVDNARAAAPHRGH